MEKYVFYSWQSDLQNSSNRGFIENCIKKALEELNMSDTYGIELSIDKDTKDETGTPHIPETIFSKIEKAKLFIADVSIINSDYDKRKTPNPNVLIELGYAAKVLGWHRIICIYNTDYGSFNDLPFDLKFRRPLSYSLIGKNKPDVRKRVIEAIKSNIMPIEASELVSITNIGSYIICETSAVINDLEAKVRSACQDEKLQAKYNFTYDDLIAETWTDSNVIKGNEESNEETELVYVISVKFTDDSYSFKDVDRECAITLTLSEKFKQINFENNKVYSAIEISNSGVSPSSQKGRDYRDLSDELIKRL